MQVNFLPHMVRNRQTWRWLLGNSPDKSGCMRNLNKATVGLVNEIRETEARLGRPHRYLPQAGFYQGRMHNV